MLLEQNAAMEDYLKKPAKENQEVAVKLRQGPSFVIHFVKNNDTLYSIAKRYYQNSISEVVDDIVAFQERTTLAEASEEALESRKHRDYIEAPLSCQPDHETRCAPNTGAVRGVAVARS